MLDKPIELATGVTLAAKRRRTATLLCKPVGPPPAGTGFEMLHGRGASKVTIRGLVIASTGDQAAAASAIVFHVVDAPPNVGGCYDISELVVEDCEIHGFKMRGVRCTAPVPACRVRRLRVARCHIHDLGLMDDPEAFGLGVQPNACVGAQVVDNLFVDIGKTNLHWGVYASDSRLLTIANNTFRRCAGGIAIAGDSVLDRIKITNNTIEDTTGPTHIGMQLTGGAHCLVKGNRLKRAIIQAATGRSPRGKASEIVGNTIDLDQLGLTEHGAIFIGASGIPAVGLLVQGNTIRNGRNSAFETADRGIRLKVGRDIKILDNEISGVFNGIFAFARTDLTPPDEPIRNLEIGRNTITDTGPYGSRYIVADNVQGLKIVDNTGRGGSPAVGISIGGEDGADVRVAGNCVGPGPVDGPIRMPAEWEDRDDVVVDPFTEIKPGVWCQK